MIVITRIDGGISIMYLVEGADADAEVEKWKGVNPDQYVSHRSMPLSALPTDRSKREQWCDNDGTKIDLNPALKRDTQVMAKK